MDTRMIAVSAICFALIFRAHSPAQGGSAFTLSAGSLTGELDRASGSLLSLRASAGDIPIAQSGGRFAAYDFKAKHDIALTAARVASDGDRVSVVYTGEQLRCDATYLVSRNGLWVQGTLRNLADADRAVVLSFAVPLAKKGLSFSPSLSERIPIGTGRSGEGSIYPVATMCGDDFGLAMAIPPTSPCMFKLVGSDEGLTLRLYLGLSEETRRAPNAARFSFMIFPCDPKWGFRDAIRRYYASFPDYYTHHGRGDGLWLFPSGLSSPPNIYDFLYHEIFASENIGREVERDHENGVLTFPYMIVGQREIKHLDALPGSYEEAMAIFDKWRPPPKADNTKECLAAGGDAYLKEEVRSSAIKLPDGRYRTMFRDTPWGGKSVTFIMNPNPDLPGEHTTGGDAMARIHQWLTSYPAIDGIYIDSLGHNWGGKLNFRRDHFAYARCPLAFDREGNVALHNQLSHYEFLDKLRADLRSRKKLLMANGVYIYKDKACEYADVTDTGRFFLASLLDAAGCESSSPSTARWEFYRVCMGPKPYLMLKYRWKNAEEVRKVFNEALCYGVFVTNSNNFNLDYWDNPEGHARDEGLYKWYVPLVRTLSKAGWQPVTHAASPTEDVRFERYGDSGDIYFTIYNPGPARECVLEIETEPLGLGKDTRVEQISGPGFIGADWSASKLTVRTMPGAKRTAVIRIPKEMAK